MRVLVAHNRYRIAGGEDAVVRNEIDLLTAQGHGVATFEAHNESIHGPTGEVRAALSLFHSSASQQALRKLLADFPADVLHVHNWFPLLSPSIIPAAAALGVPVVQTLHNFRMICTNAILYRDGGICEDCIGKSVPLNGVLHRCYRESRAGSALVAAAFAFHRGVKSWDHVARFIAVSEFQRALLIRGGIPAHRITVKPNFVPDSGPLGSGEGGYFLFAGRLTAEKGIRTVLRAWEDHHMPFPLRIAGDGPLRDEVARRAAETPGLTYLGPRSPRSIAAEMAGARALIFSSEWYEPSALTIIEAFSHGTPVIAADLESIRGLVRPGLTGLLFRPGSAAHLAATLSLLPESVNAAPYRALRAGCRAAYQAEYTPAVNYPLLLEIYEQAKAHTATNRTGHSRTTSSALPAQAAPPNPAPPVANVLGIPVHAINMERALAEIRTALDRRHKGYVLLAGAHGIVEARRCADLRTIAARALLVLPDGMPVVWLGRLQNWAPMDRVFGPDLMLQVLGSPQFAGVRHFFWGGAPGVAISLAAAMRQRFPSVQIVGTGAPPYGELAPAAVTTFAEEIARLQPDVIWVGISTPRQDRLMAQVLPGLETTLMIGVGAAFLYHTGAIRDSPHWVKRAGLQWFHRLLQEPSRLWKRYLRTVPTFAFHALLQSSGARNYPLPTQSTSAPAAAQAAAIPR